MTIVPGQALDLRHARVRRSSELTDFHAGLGAQASFATMLKTSAFRDVQGVALFAGAGTVAPTELVIAQFRNTVRTFVDELINGTDLYRQVQAFVEYIKQDYKDRFIVELIQNAHDVSEQSEVRIVYREPGTDAGALYVANRGKPFAAENFEGICRLARSTKTPAESIGNKGIGFRSVLQICTAPAIFSQRQPGDAATTSPQAERGRAFDGICFRFDPAVHEWIVEALNEALLYDGETSFTSSVLERHMKKRFELFEDASKARKLRARLERRKATYLRDEVAYLSPYALPVADPEPDAIVRRLGAEGFVTVVHLALDRAGAAEAIERALADVRSEHLLFLPRVEALVIERVGSAGIVNRRGITRSPPVIMRQGGMELRRVRIEDGVQSANAAEAKSGGDYWLASGEIEGPKLTAAIKEQELPLSWLDLKRAEVSIAIEVSHDAPREGYFSIYLPTAVRTGMPAWVNAPFFGDLSRQQINFGEAAAFNRLLLKHAASVLERMRSALATGHDEESALLALDLIDRRSDESVLADALEFVWTEAGISLRTVPAIRGMLPGAPPLTPMETWLPPGEFMNGHQVITFEALAPLIKGLPTRAIVQRRREVLARLLQRARGAAETPGEVRAECIEAIAQELFASQAPIARWQHFYQEAAHLLRGNESIALRGRRVLLTQDGRLLAAMDKGPRVFAAPVRMGGAPPAGATSAGDDPRLAIPKAFSDRVAFLHPGITLNEPGRDMPTKAGELLRSGSSPLVLRFDTREIVDDVLAAALSSLPKVVLSHDPRVALCMAALDWGYRLWNRSQQSELPSSGGTRPKWRALRVPTTRGWVLGRRAYLSKGWDGDNGELLEDALGEPDAKRPFLHSKDRFAAVFASHPDLDSPTVEASCVEFLTAYVGVWRWPQVRLLQFDHQKQLEGQDGLAFEGMNHRPIGGTLKNALNVPVAVFEAYQRHIAHSLSLDLVWRKPYAFQSQAWIDGLGTRTEAQGRAFARLVVRAIPSYVTNLSAKPFRQGGKSQLPAGQSLLSFGLRWVPWLPTEGGAGATGSRAMGATWLVEPALLAQSGGKAQFGLLPHIEPSIAEELRKEERRNALPFRRFPVANAADALALLADLEEVWPKRPIEHHDFFVRLWNDGLAWAAEQTSNAKDAELATLAGGRRPKGVLVRGVGVSGPQVWQLLVAADGDEPPPVYVPNEASFVQSLMGLLPIVVMRRERIAASHRLLQALFGAERVRLASDVALIPLLDEDVKTVKAKASPLLVSHPWLALIALAVLAFGRTSEMPVDGDTYREHVRTLHGIEVAFVDCLRLHLPAAGAGELPRAAYFWSAEGLLLVELGNNAMLDGVAEAFRSIFGVGDIEDAMARALHDVGSSLDTNEAPTRNALVSALSRVRVSEEQFQRIERSLQGDAVWIIERSMPAIAALCGWSSPDEVAALTELQSLDAAAFEIGAERLLAGSSAGVGATELAARARGAANDEEMARWLYERADIDLDRWNVAATAFEGRYLTLSNPEIGAQLTSLVDDLGPVWKALIREMLAAQGKLTEYRAQKNALEGAVHAAPEWARRYWRLPSGPIVDAICEALTTSWPAGSGRDRLDLVLGTGATSIAAVLDRAKEAGLNVEHADSDAWMTAAAMLQRVFRECREILIAYAARAGAKPPLKLLDLHGAERLLEADNIRSLGEAGKMDEAVALQKSLERLDMLRVYAKVPELPDTVGDVVALRAHLGVEDDALGLARKILEMAHTKAEQTRRTYSIAGEEYVVPQGDVFTGLFGHLTAQLPANLGDGFDPSLPIGSAAPPDRQHRGRSGVSKAPRKRMSQMDRDLVGATGEFLVYTYVIAPMLGTSLKSEVWVSRSKRHFLPGPDGDDDQGFDFEFHHGGHHWQIEVKSSTGAPGFFELGPSEVRAARSAARKGSGLKYVVVLVHNAFSNHPSFLVFGNPYERSKKGECRIDEDGARVFFQSKASDSDGTSG